MNKITFLFIVPLLAIISCNSNSNKHLEHNDGVHFGEKIDTVGMVSFDELLLNMNELDTAEVKVVGKVSSVCQTKGCWMNIVSDTDTTKTEMFVQFKDYGFFMPKDLSGKEVVMLGKAYREVTSVEDLKHFAEDEGKTAEEIARITEPVKELKFMASGVRIK